ncbi:MAG: hypothetical protein Q8P81_04025 [Nanoarchaeota archaeon]|nr:hypothetical protein [Nanoarchaeota archaeon]
MKNSFLNMKKLAGVVSAVSLVTGFFFLDRETTGNVVLNGNIPTIDVLSLIGLALVLCSGVLAYYALRR